MPRLGLHFFAEHVHTAYDYASLEAATSELEVDVAALSLTERDIEQCQADPAPAARLLLRLTKAASAQHGAALRAARDNQLFWVTLDGRKLYVGVVYIMYGAAGIATPVLHVDDQGEPIELKLGTRMGAWAGWGGAAEGSGPPSDPVELRQLFEGLGKLSTL